MASRDWASPDADLRPRFADGQVLGAADLAAEQTYLIAARRRHLVSAHTPGIVTGLEPSLQNGVVTVSPGLAVDGFGRELLVRQATVPRAGGGSTSGADAAIYVRYDRVAPAGVDPAHPRWVEQADVFTAPLSSQVVPAPDIAALPDDASAPAWPVLLGVVKAGDAGLDLSARQYAGAVGSALSPSGSESRIVFRRTGAVVVEDGPTPVLTVDAGGVTVPGDAVVEGSLTVGTVVVVQSQAAPTAASPWTLYRTRLPATAPTATAPGVPAADELRIELPAPPSGPDPTQQAVSFGTQADGADFARVMSVLTDGTVVINGNLQINGRLATAPATVDASDPRLQQALLENFVRGVQTGTEKLEEQYTGRLALTNLVLTSAGGKLTCTVTLNNVGAVTIKDIVVTAAVWPDGASAHAPDQTLARGLQLQDASSMMVQGQLKAGGAGLTHVLVRATGTGLAGAVIQANDLTGSVKV